MLVVFCAKYQAVMFNINLTHSQIGLPSSLFPVADQRKPIFPTFAGGALTSHSGDNQLIFVSTAFHRKTPLIKVSYIVRADVVTRDAFIETFEVFV